MANVTHKQLPNLLKIYYEKKIPVFLWGSIGIGKSSIVKEVAKNISNALKLGFIEGEPDGEEKFGFIDVRISQLEPSDLRGLPNIYENEGIKNTKWIIPNWLPSNVKSKGILFFDELNLATPSIQASAYQLILDRRLGDYKLPEGWVIMSAGNTSNDKANVFNLPSPLANRFTHLDLSVPTKDEWITWALKNGIDTSITSFLEFKPSFLFKYDKANKDMAFATPRSWEFCSKLLEGDLTNENKQILVGSAVGEGIAHEFMAFLKLQNQIDLKDILENPEKVQQIQDIALKFSLLGVIAEKYRTDKKALEKILNVCNYLDAEFSILLLRYLKGIRKDFVSEGIGLKVWSTIANKYGKFLID